MSLNKLTDGSVRKTWMNINANSISAAQLAVDDIELDNLIIESDNLPQIRLKGETNNGIAVLHLGDAVAGTLKFTDENGNDVGQIVSDSFNNEFKIDPKDSQTVTVEGGVDLLKVQTPPPNPDIAHLTLYSEDGESELYTKDSDGNVQRVVTEDSQTIYPAVRYRSTNPDFKNTATAGWSEVLETPFGIGSLVLPAGVLENGTYVQLKLEGTFRTVGAPDEFQFAFLVNGIPKGVIPATNVLAQSNEGYGFSLNVNASLSEKVGNNIKVNLSGGLVREEGFGLEAFEFSGTFPNDFFVDYTVPNVFSIGALESSDDNENGIITILSTMTF